MLVENQNQDCDGYRRKVVRQVNLPPTFTPVRLKKWRAGLVWQPTTQGHTVGLVRTFCARSHCRNFFRPFPCMPDNADHKRSFDERLERIAGRNFAGNEGGCQHKN
jgi:hypothetical protein